MGAAFAVVDLITIGFNNKKKEPKPLDIWDIIKEQVSVAMQCMNDQKLKDVQTDYEDITKDAKDISNGGTPCHSSYDDHKALMVKLDKFILDLQVRKWTDWADCPNGEGTCAYHEIARPLFNLYPNAVLLWISNMINYIELYSWNRMVY